MVIGLSGVAGAHVQRDVLAEHNAVTDIVVTLTLPLVVRNVLAIEWKSSDAIQNRVEVRSLYIKRLITITIN